MKKFLLSILIMLTSFCALANEEILSLIDNAQSAQRENPKLAKELNLQLADKLFTLTENGTKNANIYTMQGNAYLLANKIGMAIYSYENALKYDANNEEILNNLTYAQNLCVNKIEDNPNISMLESYFYETDFTKNNALWIFLLAWNLIFIIPLIKTNLSEIKFLWIISICFAVIFGSSVFYSKYKEFNTKPAVVNSVDTIARKGASDIFMPAYKESIKDGCQFYIIGEKNNWLHAQLKDGSTCWIKKEDAIAL